MKFNLRPLNLERTQAQLASASATSSGGKIFKFEDNTKYFFHLLPPWEGSDVIGRECWDCFGLPNIPGQKFFAHTLWKSFEEEMPGIGAKDPVLQILEKYKAIPLMEARVNPMIPFAAKFFMNALLTSTIKVRPDNKDTIEDTYRKLSTPTVETFGISGNHFKTIMNFVIRSEKSEGGSVLHPLCAGMIGIAKINDGSKVRYHVDFMGSNSPQGVIPNRYNLCDLYGEDRVSMWYKNIPNLSRRFPAPSESAQVETGLRAQALNAVLLAELKAKTPADKQPQGPGGSATNEVAKIQKKDSTGGAPLPDPTEPEAPAKPVYTPRMLREKDLGLEKAPTKDDGQPICLGRRAFVQSTPNKTWCDNCTFATMCKVQGGS